MLRQPDLPAGVRILGNTESGRLKAKHPQLSSDPFTGCITCHDRRSYRWYLPGSRTQVGEYECECADQWVAHRAMLSANIGLTYQRLSWMDLTGTEPAAIDMAQGYLESAEAYVAAGVGLIYYGTMGSGKSSLSSLLLRDLLGQGYDTYFTTFSAMIDAYTGGWNDAAERAWFHKRIKNAGVLVLDDIGKEFAGRKSSGLPESTFDEVLRHRVAASMPTIVTTNYDLARLQEGYGGAVLSLLHERSKTFGFTGEDFRPSSNHRLMDEINAGLTRPIVMS